VWAFGNALQHELDTAEGSKKHERGKKAARAQVLARWLPDMKADTPQHRDPARDNPEGVRR
jgi:hypothetical protein